jgi:hypothetical protein
MTSVPLNAPFEALGDWYLPNAPERKIAGILKYVPDDGATVRLRESFEFWFDGFHQQIPKRYDIVHGTTRAGELVTMVDAVGSGLSIDPNIGHRADDLFSTRIVLGVHIGVTHRYCRFRCRVPGLEIWLSRRTVEREHARDNETRLLELTYRVRQLKDEAFYVPELSGEIRWEMLWQVSNDDNATRVSVSSAGWISLCPDEPQSFDWFLDKAISATELLAFVTGSPMSPDVIETCDGGSWESATTHLVALNGGKCCEFTERLDFFLLRSNMGIELDAAVRGWFKICSDVDVATKLALSAFAGASRWSHLDFLLLMQSLEGLHRALFRKKYFLRDRLNALAEMLPERLRKVVVARDGTVPRSWIDTRNYYTHWNEDLRAKILSAEQIHYVNARLRTWIRFLFLQLIGISEDAIWAALKRPSGVSRELGRANFAE